VAGRLFGVRGRRTEDTEVVIFLTPRIAQPMSVESAGAPVAADPADAALERRLLNRAREIVPTDSGAEVQP
jgi:Flp pilus assembly secretin CpaC